MDNDDVRFTSFTRDLARRQRRPRSYPPAPVRADALEQLCGGGHVTPPSTTSLPTLVDAFSDDLTELDLADVLAGESDELVASS